MGLFKNLDLAVSSTIDWEMTPEYTFGTFESWGGRERIRSSSERVYYFFIDNWGDRPRLCLMERGIRHARIVAEIKAPLELLDNCIMSQGKSALFERSFAIDDAIKEWLISNVMETDDDSLVIPLERDRKEALMPTGLPGRKDAHPGRERVVLPREKQELSEEAVSLLIRTYDFYDCERNPDGKFSNCLVDNLDDLTVSDRITGLMWQREGLDIMSYRMLTREAQRLNSEAFAGYSDWRIPTLAEAMSLMERQASSREQHIHPCFSTRQPFIFTDATRLSGGYWFVDYNHGRTFWASGTIPGGFGRLCRTEPA
jgi:hypothetical protein